MDLVSLALVLGPLAVAIVMALGPGWQTFSEPEVVPVRSLTARRPVRMAGEDAALDPRPVVIRGSDRV